MQRAASNLYAICANPLPEKGSRFMFDLMFIAIGLAFLGGAMLYARACDRL